MRDLKPSKDAKGGAARHANSTQTAGHSTAGRSKVDGHIIIERADGTRPPSRFEKLRGSAGPGMTTDELMALLRGEPE